ncbi:B-box zinc finger protein 20 isoform X2 [Ricinus communis]|uniref:B-box zinc finger protein 20 isoform X2 n=1 Tax=Ricinus communis TaxID=3988 RepID=UPI000772808E|nr:B-box zinc finger protein 20 isoform X2 [Ricinus communis]|eukprot:XP_015570812.1 B-box zinc finger protein 20 [Ricinus communis]
MFTLTPAKNNIAKDHHHHHHHHHLHHIRDKSMKIKCDVCDKSEASVFCSADEAALCEACDRHVHHANKLASKHHRFSLLRTSSKQSPLCDICQERRAFLFCQEDRAILCRECDIPIHKANEHTKKHNRFLLTGIKLSNSSSLYPTSSSSNSSCDSKKITTSNKKSLQQQPYVNNINTPSFSNEMLSSSSVERASSPSSTAAYNNFDDNVSISTSSISEYLEALPGWRVDDFLDPAIATDGFCKVWSPPYL